MKNNTSFFYEKWGVVFSARIKFNSRNIQKEQKVKQNNSDIQNNHTLIDVNIPESFDKLSITDRITAVGSCFAQEMTDRLQDRCVDVTLNPFGTIYNPISIYQCLYYNFCVDTFGEENLCYESGKFFTPYHNTQFDSDTKEDILQKINGNLLYYKPRIQNSNVFLITYGTAVVYYYQKFLYIALIGLN